MKIAVLGSTGSIGTQTLEVVRGLGNIEIVALAAHSNIDLIERQIGEFKPKIAAIYDENAAISLKKRVGGEVEVVAGMEGLKQAASMAEAGLVVNAVVGNIGLLPTIAAIEAGKNVALANKEVLVCGGEVIMPMAAAQDVAILPVDSEHSAIFQCLANNREKPARLYLTASGGPFRGHSAAELANVTVAEALKHPNWAMGHKITIDSATMMNKGLEVIEARWLFDVSPEAISVVVHPQSVIHSMVEFSDGQILAQLGPPDMRLPIQYALTHPKRRPNAFGRLDFTRHVSLTFEPPDFASFPCLRLAYEALEVGGLMPTVLNAANEVAVAAFLAEKIPFNSISAIIDRTICAYNGNTNRDCVDIDNILEVEKWAKEFAGKEVF